MPADLICPRRRHARVYREVVEIHCRWCSAARGDGARVLHRWTLDGAALPDTVVPPPARSGRR